MPTVEIHMEPRDEESKARIAREVASAVAEGTNNSVAGITVIFHEHPLSQWAVGTQYGPWIKRGPREPQLPSFATVHAARIGDEAAFVRLRNEKVNPVLARQDGFVATTMLRLREPRGSYLLINKWMSEDSWKAWSQTQEDRDTFKAMMELAERWDPPPFSPHTDIVHQRFGAKGGEKI